MTIAARLHDFIIENNPLEKATMQVREALSAHPLLNKIALIVNHIFRAVMMAAFMMLLPCPLWVGGLLCLAGSLFYRLTVENNCAYKFALPSFAGATALIQTKSAVALITQAASHSLWTIGALFASLFLFTAYVAYVVLTVSYDVDQR